MRQGVEESIEGGNDGQEDKEMLKSVVVTAPLLAGGSGGNRRTTRHVPEERNNRESGRRNVIERNIGVERNVAVEDAEAPPPSPITLLTPENKHGEGEETQRQNRNPGERDAGIQISE
jgi:hypothetical protein